jgi:predicted site-specific integrase-resolvase
MSIKKKEKRDTILYAHVTKTNKKYLSNTYKKYGYSTLSEFVDTIITDVKAKEKEGKK